MSSQIYTQNLISSPATLSAANTGRDGSGTIPDIHTGTSGGNDQIEMIVWQALTTTTLGALCFYIYNGSIYVLVAEVLIPAHTVSLPQVPALRGVVDLVQMYGRPLCLPTTSHVLKGSTHVAETFKVFAQGKKYV